MPSARNGLDRRSFLELGVAGLGVSTLATACSSTVAQKPANAAVDGLPAAQSSNAAAAPSPPAPGSSPAPVPGSSPAPAPGSSPAPTGPTTPATRRVLGRTGIQVPIISMGVMNADNPNLVRAALDGGITLLDTAHGYQEGRNEEMLGTVLSDRKRESFVICTKVFLSTFDRKTGSFAETTRGEEVLEKLDLSLKRLRLDHVDILYLHAQSTRGGTLFAPVLAALEKAKKVGKTRFLGVSTHSNEPEVLRAAVEAKLYDVVLTSYNFKQDHHLEVQKAIGQAASAGLGIVAMKTQAGVYWDKEKKHPIDMKAALKWAVRDPNVHTSIPGFTTFDQLQTDLDVLRQPALTEEESKSLEPAKVAGFYCQGCRQCLGTCSQHLPIPDLMRSYMYTHAYRNRGAGQALLGQLDLPASPCTDCSHCQVRCAKGFDVRERIMDVARLRHIPREFLI